MEEEGKDGQGKNSSYGDKRLLNLLHEKVDDYTSKFQGLS
jgi:hypothetical protein